MGYEVDFLPAERGSKSGDAIALRLGDLNAGDRDDQFVAIVDGGYTESGHALVEHVMQHYKTEVIDVVISSHLDEDHIQGLTVVVNELQVRQLWMHEPSSTEVEQMQVALSEATGLQHERLQLITASIQQSQDLASLARERGIEIVAPYTGLTAPGGALRVIGPTEEYYASLVPRFRNYTQTESLSSMMAAGLEAKTGKTPGETLAHETLEEGATTGPENNSSVVTLIQVDGHAVILTGDAGAEALHLAADHLDSSEFDWSSLRAMQIPHHGSRNNVTPSVLNRYLGDYVQTARNKQAYVSCSSKGGKHHPSRRVTNAFHRRGCKVYKTAGGTKRLHHDAPDREGFSTAIEVPFYSEVD
jgi:beta-lactamase superfamily II metal-dependent hydrolase